MKRFGPFGILMALAVLLIVLLLSEKAWKAAMPAASQALKPGAPVVDDHGDKAAGDAVRSGKLPDLKAMDQRTQEHLKQIKDTAKGQD
jgi:hypothetical protein